MLVLNIAITLLVCKVQIKPTSTISQTNFSSKPKKKKKKGCQPLPPNHQRGQRTSKYPTTFKIDCPLLSVLSLSKKSKKNCSNVSLSLWTVSLFFLSSSSQSKSSIAAHPLLFVFFLLFLHLPLTHQICPVHNHQICPATDPSKLYARSKRQ